MKGALLPLRTHRQIAENPLIWWPIKIMFSLPLSISRGGNNSETSRTAKILGRSDNSEAEAEAYSVGVCVIQPPKNTIYGIVFFLFACVCVT